MVRERYAGRGYVVGVCVCQGGSGEERRLGVKCGKGILAGRREPKVC